MLLSTIQSFIQKNALFFKDTHLLLGVSGGPDSVFLLHALKKLGYKHLKVAHINHMIRGVSAAQDAQFVEYLAQEFKLPFFETEVPTVRYAREHKLSLEDAARKIRLDFFHQIARTEKVDRVVLAHNANDQVETVLMRFLRGSGLPGLIGIEPEKKIGELTIVRPLLTTWRKDILHDCRGYHWHYRLDKTNQKPIYLRNQIRLKLLPVLEKYNPNLGETVLRMVEVLREENRYLQEEATRVLNEIASSPPLGGFRGPGGANPVLHLPAKKLYPLPLALQRRVVRLAIERVKGDLEGVSSLYIENFLTNRLTKIALDSKGKLCTKK